MAFFDSSYSSSFIERNEILKKYFNDVRAFEILSPEEELVLFKKVKKGDIDARNKIINSNQRFVISFAKRWATKENLSDLINEGNIGLIKAIDTFDPERGNRFLTHAVWYIRSAINNYLISTEKIIKPVNSHKVYIAASKIKNAFYAEYGRFPTSNEITDLMEKKYNYKLSNEEDVYDIKITSIDESVDTDETYSYENSEVFSNVSSSCNIDDYIENDFTDKTLNVLLGTLPSKHQKVIKMLFGIGEIRPLEMEEVADKIGMTRERVRQLKKEILTKLQKEANIVKIKSLS